MWIVLGAVVVVVVVVVAIVAMRRPRADDLHSVQSYHSALGTLETFADRMGQSPPEVVAQADRSGEGHVRPRFYSRATADAPAAPDAPADPAAPDGSPADPGDDRAGGRASAPHPGCLRRSRRFRCAAMPISPIRGPRCASMTPRPSIAPVAMRGCPAQVSGWIGPNAMPSTR